MRITSPRGVCVSGGYRTQGTNQHTCTRVFTTTWTYSQSASITITAPRWEKCLKSLCGTDTFSKTWCGDQFEGHSIFSLSGKAPSQGNSSSFAVLPQSSLVQLPKILEEWVFLNHIFSFQMRFYTMYSWDEFFEHPR